MNLPSRFSVRSYSTQEQVWIQWLRRRWGCLGFLPAAGIQAKNRCLQLSSIPFPLRPFARYFSVAYVPLSSKDSIAHHSIRLKGLQCPIKQLWQKHQDSKVPDLSFIHYVSLRKLSNFYVPYWPHLQDSSNSTFLARVLYLLPLCGLQIWNSVLGHHLYLLSCLTCLDDVFMMINFSNKVYNMLPRWTGAVVT